MSYFKPTEGGEYSPQLIPGSGRVSAVRLDKDGTQRLYDHTPGKDVVKEVVEGLQVAYYVYYSPDLHLYGKLLTDVLTSLSHHVLLTRPDYLAGPIIQLARLSAVLDPGPPRFPKS